MSNRRDFRRQDDQRDNWDDDWNDRSRSGRDGDGRSGGGGGRDDGGGSWRGGSDHGGRGGGRDFGDRYEDRRGGDRGPDRAVYRSDRRAFDNGGGGGGGGDFEENTGIWMGGLPDDISQQELERVADKFGPITEVSIKSSARDTFAFVHFREPGQARTAIRSLDQTDPFGNGTIKVAPACRKGSGWGNGPPARQDGYKDYYGGGSDRGGRGDGGDGRYDGNGRYDSRSGGGADDRSKRDWGGDNYNGRNGNYSGRYESYNSRKESYSSGYESYKGRYNDGGGGGGRGRGRSAGRDGERRGFCVRSRSRARGTDRRAEEQEPEDKVAAGRSSNRPWRAMLSQLPKDMDQDELIEIASEYGKVLEHELHRESNYKAGWVEYATKAEAEKAVADLDDRRMEEWNLKLQAYIYPGGCAQNGTLSTM